MAISLILHYGILKKLVTYAAADVCNKNMPSLYILCLWARQENLMDFNLPEFDLRQEIIQFFKTNFSYFWAHYLYLKDFYQ